MTKEDQIAEMAAVIYDSDRFPKNSLPITMSECLFKYGGQRTNNAVALYDAGYRKQEWISVEERLPEENTEVLIYCKTNSGKEVFFVDKIRYFRGLAIWQVWSGKVTHWMPLPESPRMKGGAE